MVVQSFEVRTLRGQIAACLRLIALKAKAAVLRLIELEENLEAAIAAQFQSAQAPAPKPVEPTFIYLFSYRRKGINAYLIKEQVGAYPLFGKPVSEKDRQAAYRGKLHQIQIRVDNLPDGIYKKVEAGGGSFNKVQREYLKIQDGAVVAQSWDMAELIDLPKTLPELIGTPKQVAWAENLRSRIISQSAKDGNSIPEYVYSQTSATWYIDNREVVK
jgi:hypothetical protein